jgi:hypothetical protein
MKIKPPLPLLERAHRKAAEAAVLDQECAELLSALIEQYRYPGQPKEALLTSWGGSHQLSNFERLRNALPHVEAQITGQPTVLVPDGWTL